MYRIDAIKKIDSRRICIYKTNNYRLIYDKYLTEKNKNLILEVYDGDSLIFRVITLLNDSTQSVETINGGILKSTHQNYRSEVVKDKDTSLADKDR